MANNDISYEDRNSKAAGDVLDNETTVVSVRAMEKTSNAPVDTKKTSSAPVDVASSTTVKDEGAEWTKKDPGFCDQLFSWRMVIFVLLQFSVITLGLPRTTFNMAFVCSTNRRLDAIRMSNRSEEFSSPQGGQYSRPDGQRWTDFSLGDQGNVNGTDDHYHQRVMTDLDWDAETKGLVLSAPAFLAGAGSILCDLLRQRLGNRRVFSAFFLLASLIMFVSPWLARTNPFLVVAVQIVIGLTMEANVPVIGDVLSRWCPASQRLTASFIVFSGFSFGPILTSLVNGFLCSIDVDNGWPFIFYVSGAAYLLYAAAWNLLCSDWPENHRFISAAERALILSTRVQLAAKKRPEKPPYLTIMRSPPVLALIHLFNCLMWGNYVILVMGPIYLSSVHGFSTQQTSVVFSSMVATKLMAGVAWTALGNAIINREVMSRSTTRKVCLCLGFGGSGCTLLAMVFLDQSARWTAIACIMIGQSLNAVTTGHLSALPADMAPRYAGTLHGLSSGLATTLSLTAPLIVSALTPQGRYEEWRTVWVILACVYLSGALVFLIFGDAKLQTWAAVKPDELRQKETVGERGPREDVDQHLLVEETVGERGPGRDVDQHLLREETGGERGPGRDVDQHLLREETVGERGPGRDVDQHLLREELESKSSPDPAGTLSSPAFCIEPGQGEEDFNDRKTNPRSS